MFRPHIHIAFHGLLAGALVALGACGRTPLWTLGDGGEIIEEDAGSFVEAGLDVPDLPDPTTVPGHCEPRDEECNGVDDDCDGEVDEVPAVPCPEGGFSYCVAGHMSECPRRCEACMPGSQRVCFNSYCEYWATQTCSADGRSFGRCREEDAPPECADIASEHQYSRELEQCCIDNGYCCVDAFDLDHDGSRTDMLGRCDEVECR